jgi:hypothetical protein
MTLLNHFLDINILSSIIFGGCIGFIGYSIISYHLNYEVPSPIDSGVNTIKDSLNSPTIEIDSTQSIASTIVEQATAIRDQIEFKNRIIDSVINEQIDSQHIITNLILSGRDTLPIIQSTSQPSTLLHQMIVKNYVDVAVQTINPNYNEVAVQTIIDTSNTFIQTINPTYVDAFVQMINM